MPIHYKRVFRFSLASLLLTVLVTPIFLSFVKREPSYKKKNLSNWLADYESADPNARAGASDAVRHMGTNATPFLVKWIGYETPHWEQYVLSKIESVLPTAILISDAKQARASDAGYALQALGPNADVAVSQLAALINNSDDGWKWHNIMRALSLLGPKAMPALLNGLTNYKKYGWHSESVEIVATMETNALPLVSVLIGLLNSKHAEVAGDSAQILGLLKLEPELVVPALINSVSDPRPHVRSNSANALALFGTNSAMAVPVLVHTMHDSDLAVAAAAKNALYLIDSKAAWDQRDANLKLPSNN